MNVFTIDFNEELVALYGGSLRRQTHFLHECIKAVLRLYKVRGEKVMGVLLSFFLSNSQGHFLQLCTLTWNKIYLKSLLGSWISTVHLWWLCFFMLVGLIAGPAWPPNKRCFGGSLYGWSGGKSIVHPATLQPTSGQSHYHPGLPAPGTRAVFGPLYTA